PGSPPLPLHDALPISNPAEPSAPTKPVDTTASTVNADSTASAPTRAAWNPIPVLSRCISTVSERPSSCGKEPSRPLRIALSPARSEEHTSELQSRGHL